MSKPSRLVWIEYSPNLAIKVKTEFFLHLNLKIYQEIYVNANSKCFLDSKTVGICQENAFNSK